MGELDRRLVDVVGDKTAKALAKALDLHTVGDLLRHYPRRYVQRGDLTELDSLRVDEQVTVLAMVKSVATRSMKNRRGSIVEAVVTDGAGELTLTFFNQKWRADELVPGRIGMFAGKVGVYRARRQLAHPDYELLPESESDLRRAAQDYADEIIPVYPASERLPSWRIAKCVSAVLADVKDVPDPLPVGVLERHGLPGLAEALHAVHRPRDLRRAQLARRRLRFEEAFVLQVELARRRATTAALPAQPRVARQGGLVDALDAQLPFALTEGQRRIGAEIAADLAREHPMHRLLQGEVGAGKTVVALRAMLAVVDTGGQAVLLAPTEVLAQQHHRSLTQLLGPLAQRGMLGGSDTGTRVALVTGSMSAAARRSALLDIGVGDAGIVVGTHALLEERVQFFDLGLVVVDEQHRFGVEQRAALATKSRDGTRPHVLVMTATPIPRTVAMTVFGDLETSTLAELPGGRAEVQTHVVPAGEKPHYLGRAWQRVREEAEAGHRVYVVAPRIGTESDNDAEPVADDRPDPDEPDFAEPIPGVDSAPRRPLALLELADMVRAGPLAGLEIETLHGRMPPDAKDAAMRRFASGAAPILLATTVVEVGVDVPEASMMVIMDADRFGVSQLHQLRGRIGRGAVPGVCLLVTDSPPGTPARDRLEAVARTRDGFELSRVDLEQRREGDVLGASQSGQRSSLRLLRVIRDEDLIVGAREDAVAVVEADPELRGHPALADAVEALLADQRADYLDKT
jgi:ATP-dependent DNA helicase RecG